MEPSVKICADVGGSFVDAAIVSDDAQVLHRQKFPTPIDDWGAFVGVFDGLQRRHGALLAATAPISIALAGLLDSRTGMVSSANIGCIHGRKLQHDLQVALGRRVYVTNDADCFVLAETRLGAARGHRDVFGVVLGTGVGGGVVLGDRLVTSAAGIGGEWGHGPVVTRSRTDPAATPYFPCGCGLSGCLNTVGGARGLERLHAYLHGLSASSGEITMAWEAGDPTAGETMALYLELVSGPLAAILNVLPVTIVPVGGGLANCHRLVAALDTRVRAMMLGGPAGPMLVPTTLGGDAGLIGAMLAAESPAL